MSTNTLRNCPSARTLYKRLMRGAHGRSRIYPTTRVPLAAYPTQPPTFTPPGKLLYHNVWQIPSHDGREVTIHIDSMSSNCDPRTASSRMLTPTVTEERNGWFDYHECGVYTSTSETDKYTSIVDADPTILAFYLARKAWLDHYCEGVGAPEEGKELAWIGDIAGSCYGWYTKGCYSTIEGDYLVMRSTVKSCYNNRVRKFCKHLAAALKVCSKAGVKVHVSRGEA